MSLKQRTIHGISWNLINNLSMHGVQLIIGIILARLLSPQEFGLIGLTTIFTALLRSFVDSGFSAALIRKKTCTQSEYSTVFYYNLLASIVIYVILFVSAPKVSIFLNEPQLTNLIRIVGLQVVIIAISQIQRTILTKEIDFKRLAIISVLSTMLSGLIAIAMAVKGYGVWSLAFQMVSRSVFETILLWTLGHWQPSIVFSISAFKELFRFGSRLLASGLLNTAYQNIYKIVIGKYFSVSDLGFYTRARRFSDIVGINIYQVFSSVTYPVMASFSNDTERLRRNFKRLFTTISLISCFFSLLLAACADSLIYTLIGDKWAPSIPYLQLLCFSSMLYPVHALNLNLLKVKGRSDLFLKIEIYKKLFAIPTIFVGIKYGIMSMLIMINISSIIAFMLNSYYSAKLIAYSTIEQSYDIIKNIVLSLTIVLPVYIIGQILQIDPLYRLLIQMTIGFIGGICMLTLSRTQAAVEIREVAITQVKRILNKNGTAPDL